MMLNRETHAHPAPILNADQRAWIERDAAEFADATWGPPSDAMDLETLNAALQEQLQKSIATNERLVRELCTESEVHEAAFEFAHDEIQRAQAALVVAGVIGIHQARRRADEEFDRLQAKIKAIRGRYDDRPAAGTILRRGLDI